MLPKYTVFHAGNQQYRMAADHPSGAAFWRPTNLDWARHFAHIIFFATKL
jgi:hypothetical protein